MLNLLIGLGLVILANMLLGSITSIINKKFNLKKLGNGIIKGSVVLVSIGLLWLAGVLNPDVVVRSRGVMEKCSMCVQRIQYGKLEAKKAGRRPKDGEINTACAQSCPTNAITFGDYNDPSSRLSA